MMMTNLRWFSAALVVMTAGVAACTNGGRLTMMASAHEQYVAKLRSAGIDQTALGMEWITASEAALRNAVLVETPFREMGYFPPTEPMAVGYRVNLRRGRQLAIDVTFESIARGHLFVDLFYVTGENPAQRVASLNAERSSLVYDVDRDGAYILRIQPELLRGGRFTIQERTLASLRFPIEGLTTQAVQSIFGAARDAGAREHEGIDIFAPKGTAVLAVATGVARTSTNALGGQVVWLRELLGARTFYYAHLDRWAIGGMAYVREGEIVGYVGDTGNARSTAPHLHFGIYAQRAIDPLPFLQPDDGMPAAPKARGDRLGQLVRVTAARAAIREGPAASRAAGVPLDRGSLARVLGISESWVRVLLPDQTMGYVSDAAIGSVDEPLGRERLAVTALLRERPSESAPIVDVLEKGVRIAVIGRFTGYDLVRSLDGRVGWINRRRQSGASVPPTS